MIAKFTQDLKRHHFFYVILMCVIMISAGMRLWGLGNVPFVADEFLDVNATYGHFKTGLWQAWDFNIDAPSARINEASDERAWIYRWQVSRLYNFLPPEEMTIRLVSVLWGVIMTLVMYFVTLSFTKDRWIALIAAFLWAVSVPAIEINRKVRMYSMFAPIFLLFMWSLYHYFEAGTQRIRVEEKSMNVVKKYFAVAWGYLIVALLLLALSMHLHPLTGNFVIVVFFYMIAMALVSNGDDRKRYFLYVMTMIFGSVVVAIVRPTDWAYFLSTLQPTMHISYLSHLLRNYWHPLFGLLVLLVGTWALLKNSHRRREGMWIVCTFFVITIMAMFLWGRNVGPQYIFFVQPFGLIIAAVGAKYCIDLIVQAIGGKKTFIFGVAFVAVFLPNYGYFMEENNTYHITSTAETANYRKVFLYVKQNYVDGEVIITRNFRNYYFGGLGAQIFDFGSERSEEQLAQEGKVHKITRAYVQEIIQEHPAGWVVIADNDETFIEKEAQDYFEQNMDRIKGSSLLNGDVRVYHWGMMN